MTSAHTVRPVEPIIRASRHLPVLIAAALLLVANPGLSSGQPVISIGGDWDYSYTGLETFCLEGDCQNWNWVFTGTRGIWQSGSSIGWPDVAEGCPREGIVIGKTIQISGPIGCHMGVKWNTNQYTAQGQLSDDYNTITMAGYGTAVGTSSAPFGGVWHTSIAIQDSTTFTRRNPYLSLTINPTPVNGRIIGEGIDCGTAGGGDCFEPFASGTTVTLTAEPAAGYRIETWSGCPSPSGASCTVSMTQSQSVSASFTPLPALSLAFTLNQAAFTSGDTLHLDLTVENSGGATNVDVLFGVLLPATAGPKLGCPSGDAIIFLADNFVRSVMTCLSTPQNVAPLAANLPVPGGVPATLMKDFFILPWPSSAPAGPYTFFLALTSPGTLDLITLADTTITFTP